jgi:hypothetical protein
LSVDWKISAIAAGTLQVPHTEKKEQRTESRASSKAARCGLCSLSDLPLALSGSRLAIKNCIVRVMVARRQRTL